MKYIYIGIGLIILIFAWFLISMRTESYEIDNLFTESSFTTKELIDKLYDEGYYDSSVEVYTESDELVIKYKHEELKLVVRDGIYYGEISNDNQNYNAFIELFGTLIAINQELLGNFNYLNTYNSHINEVSIATGLNIYKDSDTTYIEVPYNTVLEKSIFTTEYKSGDIIEFDSTEYLIKVDDLIFTDIELAYTEEIDFISLCGVVSGESSSETFNYKLYDKDDTLLYSSSYMVGEENINQFCFEVQNETFIYSDISKYSIEINN